MKVAIIIGRFQLHKLHEGHRDILEQSIHSHDKTIVFLGLSSLKCTTRDPLDFDTRRQMIQEKYPQVYIKYINDCYSDYVWSNNLDQQIKQITSEKDEVILYGSRDSFIPYYHGIYKTQELEQRVFISATEIRKQLAKSYNSNEDFRAGVIWATMNQWPAAIPTVDAAIFNPDKSAVLLGQKKLEDKFRFCGGFVSPGENYESCVKREVNEECGIEIVKMNYICSNFIDDWRYRSNTNKITTAFYEVLEFKGRPTPGDDIDKLEWLPFNKNLLDMVVDNHIVLMEILLNRYN